MKSKRCLSILAIFLSFVGQVQGQAQLRNVGTYSSSTSKEHQQHPRQQRQVIDGRHLVFDGTQASLEDYPWMVLFDPPTGAACSGTLISPDTVLSSATCLLGFPFPDPLPIINSIFIGGRSGTEVDVDCYTFHPDYVYPFNDPDFQGNNDIVTIKLATPVEGVEPVALNSDPTIPEVGRILTFLGFGINNDNTTAGSEILYQHNTNVGDTDSCLEFYSGVFDFDPEVFLCAMDESADQSFPCGDDGGPLYDEDLQVQVAMYPEWSLDCEDGLPIIYTDIAHHYDYLQERINSTTCDLPSSSSGGGGCCFMDLIQGAVRWTRNFIGV